MSTRALLVVDVQVDFCPGGKLPVPHGDAVVVPLNRYIDLCHRRGYPIIASRDWHPPRSKHFRDYGGTWPEHCVQGTQGASFHPLLRLAPETIVVSKGMDPERDGYTAFHGVDPQGRFLADVLRKEMVQEVLVGGLATDYCVKESVLDALDQGFAVRLLTDAIQGIEVLPGDNERAITEMINRGAIPSTFDELELEILVP